MNSAQHFFTVALVVNNKENLDSFYSTTDDGLIRLCAFGKRVTLLISVDIPENVRRNNIIHGAIIVGVLSVPFQKNIPVLSCDFSEIPSALQSMAETLVAKYEHEQLYVEGLGFPREVPNGFGIHDLEEPVFDPKIHLQLEFPKEVTLLNFKEVPSKGYCREADMAWCSPFRIMSDEGVRVLRRIIDKNLPKLGITTDNRIPLLIRHLAYNSKFIRDLNTCEELVECVSRICAEPLAPHTMHSNYSHINIGVIGSDKPVDQWHVDSVDYVLIVVLSDTTDMEGGKLEVIAQPPEIAIPKLAAKQVAPSEVVTVTYPGAGYGLFMQGSKIAHHVTSVISAREPRISLVNSYVSRNVFAEDKTKFATFRDGSDKKHITYTEYAKHKAWRVAGQLTNLMDTLPFISDKATIAQRLKDCEKELQKAIDLIEHKANDRVGFYGEDVVRALQKAKFM